MAISEAVFAIRRSALRACASGDSSQPSGSKAEAAETDVRSIDIGEVCSRQGPHQLHLERMEIPLVREERGHAFELRRGGELQMMEEVDDLLERGMLGEVLDLVPDVGERPLLAVDVGELGVGRDDLSEPLVGHDPPVLR